MAPRPGRAPDDRAAVSRAQPTALALIDGTAWVGTHDGRVVAVDADSGSVLEEMERLQGRERGPGPVGIVPTGQRSRRCHRRDEPR